MSRRTPPLDIRLSDDDAERVRRSHAAGIREQQAHPAVDLVVLSGVELDDGVQTPVSHGLGRAPRIVKLSVPRGAAAPGYVNEIRDGVDRSRQVVLQANGYGATITVDVEVF